MEHSVDNHKGLVPPPPTTSLDYFAATARMEETVGVWTILNTLWRRKWLIVAIVLPVLAVAGIIVSLATPIYTAQSLLIIKNSEPNIVTLKKVVAGVTTDSGNVESELQILLSPMLAKRVINRLRLGRDPEFNRSLRADGWLHAMSAAIFGKRPPSKSHQQAAIINAFLDRLDVSQQGQSRVLVVKFSSQDPTKAARVANTVSEVYIQQQREAKQRAAEADTKLLDMRVSALRQKVEAADMAVEGYRRKFGLIQVAGGTSLNTQQLSEINTQLVTAQAERSTAEARLHQMQKLAATKQGIESSSEVLKSGLIQNLREQEAQLQAKMGEMSAEYGPRHPAMVHLRAKIEDLQAKIKSEADRIIDGMKNDVATAKAREIALRNSIDELKSKVESANEKAIHLRALEREADTDRTLLATFLARFKESSLQQDIQVQQADARIISLADPPIAPSAPQKGLSLAFVFVGSSFLGMLVVLVSEQRDQGFRSSAQVEETMGIPVLGAVPNLGRPNRFIRRSATRRLLKQPQPELNESVQDVYASLFLSHTEAPPKSILITSTMPKEGKTLIAVSLARMLARAGHQVVVVDADCRNPGVHNAYGVSRTPGLVDLVAGKADSDAVVRKDPLSEVDCVPAGNAVSNPLNILTSARLDNLLEMLAERYDFIIIDAPPSMPFADARILSTKVDKTVFVVRWGHAPQDVVRTTLKHFTRSGGPLGGVVLSMVDDKIYPQYSYAG